MKSNADRFMDRKELEFLRDALIRQLEAEVSNFIYDLVQDKVNSRINQFAKKAVAEWSVNVSKDFDALNNEVRINVQFIENIIKTVAIENKIKIDIDEDLR